jgi:hypothetical protein
MRIAMTVVWLSWVAQDSQLIAGYVLRLRRNVVYS